jgi:anti-sigma B factor antagonist
LPCGSAAVRLRRAAAAADLPACGVAMHVSVETTPDQGAVVRLSGELDFRTVSGLVSRAEEGLAARLASLAVDLSGVAFCDSTGLRALVRLARKAAELGVPFSLTAPSEHMRTILHLCGLDGFFVIHDTA